MNINTKILQLNMMTFLYKLEYLFIGLSRKKHGKSQMGHATTQITQNNVYPICMPLSFPAFIYSKVGIFMMTGWTLLKSNSVHTSHSFSLRL